MRKISLLVNKITGGTVQNLNTGSARGEAFPGMAEACRKAADCYAEHVVAKRYIELYNKL